jgi:DNA primase
LAGEIDEIRARIDIVALVGQRVQLKKTGRNFQGLCPFHDDKRPSFSVNPILQRYRCWSCGEHGDIFTWVMKTQNMEFVEALQTLANQAGVTLTKRAVDKIDRTERALQLEIMEAALEFFRDQLAKSSTAMDYLIGRDLDKETIATFEIGYAPDVGEALAVHLKKKGYSLALCRELFLVEEDASGGYFDKFRGRIMFPIRDERGALVAFGGRVLGDGMPKYINSSDTPLYRKGKVLYGMNHAITQIAKSKPRRTVLCEGYLDVIACQRSGVVGAVASLGTALSEDHAKLLQRVSDETVILYDADSAGQKAADRALEVLRPLKQKVRVALMPDGEDPDTLLRKKGPTAIVKAVEEAASPMSFRIDQIVASHEEKDQTFWSAIVSALVQGGDVAEIERYIERLVSKYSGVQDQLYIRESLRKQVMAERRRQSKPAGQQVAAPVSMRVSDLQVAEATLVAALLTPGLRSIAHEAMLLPELMVSDAGRQFALSYAATFAGQMPNGEPSVWIGKLDEVEQDLVHQCASDGRFSNLSDRFVKDAVARLESALKRRELQLVKQVSDPDRLKQIHATLTSLKAKDR